MKTVKCYDLEKLKALIPNYECTQVLHIFQGDTMGNSTAYYYFVKPGVNKLFTDMDWGSDKVELLMNDNTKIDLSFHAVRKAFGEFRINDIISPPLTIRDNYVEATSKLDMWLIHVCNFNDDMLNDLNVTLNISENITYDRVQDVLVYDGIIFDSVQLSDTDVQKVIDRIDDTELKESIKTILLAKRWRRVETGYTINEKS